MSFLARSTAGRTVHLKVHPRPASIADTKQVLAALRKFGEIEMFRHLKYEAKAPAPNSFLAIYRNAESAERAIEQEVLDVSFAPLPSQDGPSDSSTPRPGLVAVRASVMNHEMYIARQPYASNYPQPTNNSLYADMRYKMQRHSRLMYAMSHMNYAEEEQEQYRRKKYKAEQDARKEAMGDSGYMGIYERVQRARQGSVPSPDPNRYQADPSLVHLRGDWD